MNFNCMKSLLILLSQALILNKTDTFALFSLPHDTLQNMKKIAYLKKTVLLVWCEYLHRAHSRLLVSIQR